MATNSIPKITSSLLDNAETASSGLAALATELNLGIVTEASMNLSITALRNADTAFRDAEANQRLAGASARQAAGDVADFLAAGKSAVCVSLGRRWTPLHSAAGFPTGSLRLPKSPDEGRLMLTRFQDFLTRHPQYADARPEANITAVRAGELAVAFDDTRSAVQLALSERAGRRETRDAAVDALQSRLRDLLGELRLKISKDDPAWYSFGFRPPGRPSLPPMPGNLTVTLVGSGTAILTWPVTRGATRYAIYRQIMGTHPQPQRLTSVRDRQYAVTGLPPAATIRFSIAGVNEVGEGASTDPVEVVVG